MIGFNKPYISGNEIVYIEEAIKKQKISGNGFFTQQCQNFIQKRYGISKVLLTSSCTDALEMIAILLNIQEGDEVIMPSYTFVSTANAFILRGAKVVFADSSEDSPNLDVESLEVMITPKTKAIVVVHYAGMCCDMDRLIEIKNKYNLFLVEDAAHAIESTYKGRPLGSIGDLSCFSFHETKNIISGEGGALLINNETFIQRSEIIWEKGTNRSAFFRGEVNKYKWIDVGSSFMPSEITAAFLLAQLENIEVIQNKRNLLWNNYKKLLQPLANVGLFKLPIIDQNCNPNSHIFYIVCKNETERDALLQFLNQNEVNAISHYLSLNKSPFYANFFSIRECPNSDTFTNCLIRLPLYFELTLFEIQHIVIKITEFYK